MKQFNLGDAMSYYYLSQGEDPKIPGVDDAQDFVEFIKAFNLLKISEERMVDIFRVLVGILTLGNIQFTNNNDIASILVRIFGSLGGLRGFWYRELGFGGCIVTPRVIVLS